MLRFTGLRGRQRNFSKLLRLFFSLANVDHSFILLNVEMTFGCANMRVKSAPFTRLMCSRRVTKTYEQGVVLFPACDKTNAQSTVLFSVVLSISTLDLPEHLFFQDTQQTLAALKAFRCLRTKTDLMVNHVWK